MKNKVMEQLFVERILEARRARDKAKQAVEAKQAVLDRIQALHLTKIQRWSEDIDRFANYASNLHGIIRIKAEMDEFDTWANKAFAGIAEPCSTYGLLRHDIWKAETRIKARQKRVTWFYNVLNLSDWTPKSGKKADVVAGANILPVTAYIGNKRIRINEPEQLLNLLYAVRNVHIES